jgi:hypothetical protein
MEMLHVAADVVRPAIKTTNTKFENSVFSLEVFDYLFLKRLICLIAYSMCWLRGLFYFISFAYSL